MEYSPFSMLRKAYFELGHQHIDCPTDGGVKKKDVSKELYIKRAFYITTDIAKQGWGRLRTCPVPNPGVHSSTQP